MNWFKAIPDNELQPGDRRVVRVGKRQVLLLHHQGEIFAVDNACPHLGFPLQMGRVDDECALHCPWHRSAFDLRTGDVKTWSPWPPGVGRVLGSLSREKTLPVYPVRVEDGSIWIGMEEQTG